MLVPENAAQVGIYGPKVIGAPSHIRHLFEAPVRDQIADDDRLEDRVERLLLVLELQLPKKLEVLHILLRNGGLQLLPTGPLRIATVGQPIGHALSLRRRYRQ